jgi:hypothetical protein
MTRGKAEALHIGEDAPFQAHYTFISRRPERIGVSEYRCVHVEAPRIRPGGCAWRTVNGERLPLFAIGDVQSFADCHRRGNEFR